MGAFRDITDYLPAGMTIARDMRTDEIYLTHQGICYGPYYRELLQYATHMEFDRFFRDIRVDFKMPRNLEESRLWC